MKNKKTFLYPKTAKEALKKWDSGESIFTVEMGGLGPGYEQVIHIAAFELIRDELGKKFPPKEKSEKWWPQWGEKTFSRINGKLGMSGAQAGAAKNLAYKYLKYGYAHMIEKAPQDRHIQIEKEFPKL